MGLSERRAAAAFQQAGYPAIRSRIEAAAGFPVTVEVDWESLSAEGLSHLYDTSWPAVYFDPLIAALSDITRDAMGQDALRARLRRIVVRNREEIHSATMWARFEDGVLTLDHEPTTNIHRGEDRAQALVQVLERGL
ncbi:MAG TPA: hypothetical protein VD970_05355 [Acetobacteraceae bacterium]|nr:hypothetical protein [Acetobacteraceae bacterium]